MGWSLDQFWALKPRERDFWISYFRRRRRRLAKWVKALARSEYPDASALVAVMLEEV